MDYHRLGSAAGFRFFWDKVLFPLAEGMAAGLESIVEAWGPDVIVADQEALAGAPIARKHKVTWVTSATTHAELINPLFKMPHASAWLRDRFVRLQLAVGVPRHAVVDDLLFSNQLVLIFGIPEMLGTGAASQFPAHYRFVGPAISDRPEPHTFPWDWLDPKLPHVLMSMGTLNEQVAASLFAVAAGALAGEPIQAVFASSGYKTEDLPVNASNILVRDRVPQLALLPHMDAVISHGGQNTMSEALANGLPMILAPMRADQPMLAKQMLQTGAVIHISPDGVQPHELRAAVWRVLNETSYRDAAGRLKAALEAAGGAAAAAAHLEALAQREH